jgi:hypothetical protein
MLRVGALRVVLGRWAVGSWQGAVACSGAMTARYRARRHGGGSTGRVLSDAILGPCLPVPAALVFWHKHSLA